MKVLKNRLEDELERLEGNIVAAKSVRLAIKIKDVESQAKT